MNLIAHHKLELNASANSKEDFCPDALMTEYFNSNQSDSSITATKS